MRLKTTYLLIISIAVAMLFVHNTQAQRSGSVQRYGGQRNPFSNKERDTLKAEQVPQEYRVWTIDERLGAVRPTQPDTLPYLFYNRIYTEGQRGEYNFTGNLGAPRLARIYNGQQDFTMGREFIFARPYDYYLRPLGEFLFYNTKSPIAILDYFSAGGKQDGEDRFKATFATNVNKSLGFGFDLDYVYGRGFYSNQSHSSFGATLFGSYHGRNYQAHALYRSAYLKNLENGGVANENYITNPTLFGTNYSTQDIPVRLSGVRNRLSTDELLLSHRYSLGYTQLTDQQGRVVKRIMQEPSSLLDSVLLPSPKDSTLSAIPQHNGGPQATENDTSYNEQFVPVLSFIHTLRTDWNMRDFWVNGTQPRYFLEEQHNRSVTDRTDYLSVQNTFGLEMREGFQPWVKAGLTVFAKHEFLRIVLPSQHLGKEHYFGVGGQIAKSKGTAVNYRLLGELRTTGKKWGEFNVEGQLKTNLPWRKDTLRFEVQSYLRNESPAYYYRHYHARHAWWDKELNKVFRLRAQAALSYQKSRLFVGLENIQNYAYFQEQAQLPTGSAYSLDSLRYGVTVAQTQQNIQVVHLGFSQQLRWGILNWDNEINLQKSSNDRLLPLPLLNLWSNLYLRFKIAKVLHTELGADVRYFTAYNAPAYSPIIGHYALQDAAHGTKVGNYPWVNAYLNFMLKGVRFYLAYSHINSGEGAYFLVPHYPTNQRTLRFGITWTFFN